MAFGKLERKDLNQEFLNYVEEKWTRYERAKKKSNSFWGSPKALYWSNQAYKYRVMYDIAMAEYDQRIARDGVKLTEK